MTSLIVTSHPMKELRIGSNLKAAKGPTHNPENLKTKKKNPTLKRKRLYHTNKKLINKRITINKNNEI